jgi:hypothetical protein
MIKTSQAMGELCLLMLQHQLDADTFARWVRRYYGETRDQSSEGLVRWVATHHRRPHPLDTLRTLELDKYLRELESTDTAFTRALIELRNVFAHHANLAEAATVVLSPPIPAPVPREVRPVFPRVEVLGEFLSSPAGG